MNRKMYLPGLAVSACLLSSAVWAAAPGAYAGGKDTTYGWKSMDMNASQAAKKPIVVYVYDQGLKNNNMARTVETKIFVDAKVKEALAGFTYIMLRKDGKGWPADVLQRADGGVALLIMTCDGTSFGAWSKGVMPTPSDVIGAAKQAAASNAAAAERLSKRPPPKPEEKPKGQEVAAARKGPAAQEEKQDQKIAIPGLGVDDPKKEPPKKKKGDGKVEDE